MASETGRRKEPVGGESVETETETSLGGEPEFGGYSAVEFDVHEDLCAEVAKSCHTRISGRFHFGRVGGVDLVVDRETCYYNASALLVAARLEELMRSEVMENCFRYVRDQLRREPHYEVTDEQDPRLNGVYMHAITAGNVIGAAMAE